MMRPALLALVSFFLLAPLARAEDTVPITPHLDGVNFDATVPPGYHFNEQAPNTVRVDGVAVKPNAINKTKITFTLPGKDFKSGKASLYVCDDKLTFCQPETVNLRGDAEAAPESAKAKKKTTLNAHGFIEDDLAAAFEQARKEKKLVLADFSARWCPGCVRLEADTFATPEFKKTSADFVKVRLDVDRFENNVLSEKYGIKGIPAVLALNLDENEISRSVDYQPPATLTAFLKAAEKNPIGFEDLKKRADKDDLAAAELLGQRYYAAGKYANALPYLEKIKPVPIELRDARVQVALASTEVKPATDPAPANDKAAAIKTISDMIKEEPASTRSINWRAGLITLLDEKNPDRKTTLEAGVKLADQLLANPAKLKAALKGDPVGEFAGYEKLYIAVERADLIEAAYPAKDATPSPDVVAAYKLAAKIGDESHISPNHLGPSIRYLIFMSAAQEYAKAETWAKALLKKYPDNAEIERRLVRILNGEKKFDEAVAVGRKCLPHSYGRNEVWVAEQLTKALLGAGQKAEAHKLVVSYLDRGDLSWPSMARERKEFEEWRTSTNE